MNLRSERPAFPVDLGALTWVDLGAMAAIATALVAIVTIIFAGLDSASRTRPYIIAEARIPKFAHKKYVLVISNAGLTPARNLRITFDPPLERYVENESGGRSTHFIEKRYKHTIAFLGPGQELTNAVAIDPKPNVSPFPLDVTVFASYDRRRWFGKYQEQYRIQGDVVINHTDTTPSEALEPRIGTVAEKIEKAGIKIAQAVANSSQQASDQ